MIFVDIDGDITPTNMVCRKDSVVLTTTPHLHDRQQSFEICTTADESNPSSSNNMSNHDTISHPISSPRSDSPEARPVERAIEARSGSEDGQGSMVRCLQFAETFIANRKYTYLLFNIHSSEIRILCI